MGRGRAAAAQRGGAAPDAPTPLDAAQLVRRSGLARFHADPRAPSFPFFTSSARGLTTLCCLFPQAALSPEAAVDALLLRFAAGERYPALRAVLRRANPPTQRISHSR